MNDKITKEMIRKKIFPEIRNWCITILCILTIIFIFNSKVYANVQIQQSSMENTFYDSQQVIEDEMCYNFSKPQRNDIIIFFSNENKGSLLDDLNRYVDRITLLLSNGENNDIHERLIKRVIGVEGDVIDIRDDSVYINGEKLDEPYVKGTTYSNGMETPITVGKDELFVLGDNREVSLDSRAFGLININQVEGKVVCRIYPFDKIGKVE